MKSLRLFDFLHHTHAHVLEPPLKILAGQGPAQGGGQGPAQGGGHRPAQDPLGLQ
jgi:hypothetical protein